MKDKVGVPTFPPTQDQFDPRSMNEMQRMLVRFLNELLTSGPCSISKLTLTDTPTSSSGLRSDVVFVEDGYLKLSGQSQANHYKAGTVTISDGTATSAVAFATSFSDSNYSISFAVSAELGGFGTTPAIWYTSKAASGFTINRTDTIGAVSVDWKAVPHSDL